MLLQLMDDGRLTDGEGRTVDFTNTVVVLTSHLGAGEARRGLGFTAAESATAGDRMRDAAKSAFLPEFLGRIDEVGTFAALTPEQVERIAAILDGRLSDGATVRAGLRDDGSVALDLREPALAAA